MKKLSKTEMKAVKGRIGTCMAILICNCNGKNQQQIVNCVYVGGGWNAGCSDSCGWESTVVDYCDLC